MTRFETTVNNVPNMLNDKSQLYANARNEVGGMEKFAVGFLKERNIFKANYDSV